MLLRLTQFIRHAPRPLGENGPAERLENSGAEKFGLSFSKDADLKARRYTRAYRASTAER